MSFSDYNDNEIRIWLRTNRPDYEDELDLAADCCSSLNLWGEDMSIPHWLMGMAKEEFAPVYEKQCLFRYTNKCRRRVTICHSDDEWEEFFYKKRICNEGGRDDRQRCDRFLFRSRWQCTITKPFRSGR